MLETQMKLESIKTDGKSQLLAQDASIKQALSQQEFQQEMQLKQMELGMRSQGEASKEDRKDQRTKMQATQQSELIDQRTNQKPPKNFETAGDDTLGGFNLGAFGPK